MREPFQNITDETLWERYRTGDERAFTELFQRYYRKLVHYGLKFTPDQQQTEDSIQELMIRLWTKRHAINETESVKYYLLKSFRHILFRKLKQTRIYSEQTDDTDNLLEDISIEECIIREESHLSLQNKVKSLLDQLTPRQQEILYLRFYQNLTPPEIAVLLEINAQSVSNIIQRAFLRIRGGASKILHNSAISVAAILSLFF